MSAAAGTRRPSVPTEVECGIPAEDIVAGVASLLEHFVVTAAASAAPPKPTAFDGDETLCVRDYCYMLARAGIFSKECFILALVYGERVLQAHPDFTISSANVHRLILISAMVASKVLDDFNCRNVYYARAGGLSIQVVNELELTLVFMLDFNVQVKPEEFGQYRDTLKRETVVKELATPMASPSFSAAVIRPPVKALSRAMRMEPGAPKGVSVKLAPTAEPFTSFQGWQPLVTPPAMPHQMVMPVTIVSVPQYSMTEQRSMHRPVQQQLYVGHVLHGPFHQPTLHPAKAIPLPHPRARVHAHPHALGGRPPAIPLGPGMRYGWPC
mmetsp:Transcript_16970/g.44189  ORF Transcript_16970/g.44189 Transcript_16970/m.44189 type:complete len:326 (+) Transcript_16970:463-1440(+)